jgi:hypothetical protein
MACLVCLAAYFVPLLAYLPLPSRFLALFDFCLRCHGTRLGAGPLLSDPSFSLPPSLAPSQPSLLSPASSPLSAPPSSPRRTSSSATSPSTAPLAEWPFSAAWPPSASACATPAPARVSAMSNTWGLKDCRDGRVVSLSFSLSLSHTHTRAHACTQLWRAAATTAAST